MLNDQGTAPNWIGFALNQVNGTDDFRLIKGSTTSWDIHVLGQVILGENEITFKNDGLSYEGTLNGVPFSGTFSEAMAYTDHQPTTIGSYKGTAFGVFPISVCKMWELGASYVRTNELINLDWQNGSTEVVPNIAANAPAASDMVWSDSAGEYVAIPADPNNAGKDVNGNDITNQTQVTKYTDIRAYLDQ
jgi:hypothetical protein